MDTAVRLFLPKFSFSRFTRSSNVWSSMKLISFPCSCRSSNFVRPANKPFSSLTSLLNCILIVSRLMLSLNNPKGTDLRGLLDISTLLSFTKPSKPPTSIVDVFVVMNSTFSSSGVPAKAPLGIVLIWLFTKKTSVTPDFIVWGIAVADAPKTSRFSFSSI